MYSLMEPLFQKIVPSYMQSLSNCSVDLKFYNYIDISKLTNFELWHFLQTSEVSYHA